jgi:hypothetical protein
MFLDPDLRVILEAKRGATRQDRIVKAIALLKKSNQAY